MSDAADEVKFTLKAMINKQKNEVLFVEADNDFTDVLLSFLTLPLGKILKVLEGHYGDEGRKVPVIGSLTTLYKGLSDLDRGHFLGCNKNQLLNPFEAERVKLKLSVDYPQISEDEDDIPLCKKLKSKKSKNLTNASSVVNDGDVGGLTIKSASFIITADMQIAPVVPGSVLQTLINVGITDPGEAELRIWTFGFSEIVNLLEESLLPKTTMDCVTENLLQDASKGLSSSSSKKMTVKAMVQKSTNKILFVEAENDFVDFICSFLIIPLGAVECLLGGNSCLKNIDNFYKSIANIDGDKFLKTKDTKAMLLKPKLSEYYNCNNFFLPFAEKGLFTSKSGNNHRGDKFVGQKMYNVTDDLVVTPFCMASIFSLLNRHKIPFSDVNEVELVIGLDEALRILKASLTSNTALTDGLMNSISKKQPKQEH